MPKPKLKSKSGKKKSPKRLSGYANSETMIVHTTTRGDSCRQSEILMKNIVKFASLTEALEAGYRKCLRCKW